MKTIMDKQEFAKLIFNYAHNIVKHFTYDLFYDIGKLHNAIDYHNIGEEKTSYFVIFIRQTGFDLVETNKYYTPISEHEINCIEYRTKNNNIVIRAEINSGSYLKPEVITLETIKKEIPCDKQK